LPIATRYPRLFALLVVAAPLVGAQVALLGKRRGAGSVATSAALGLLALAVVLGLGGLLAYSGSNPWLLLEGAGWLLVGAAVVLCWMARSRIAASEGTLGGAALAGWGLTLSLCFGLVYGAYLSSSTFAIRGQAKQLAEEYFAEIARTDDPDSLYRAFSLMLPVTGRPKSDLRAGIEIGYNTPGDAQGKMLGMFSRFRTHRLVRLLRFGDATATFNRTEQSSFNRGAYDVVLVYDLDTPLGKYEIQVGTTGQEVSDASGTRRQWQIVHSQTVVLRDLGRTPLGARYEASLPVANQVAHEWAIKARLGYPGAYLDTLDAKQRALQNSGAILQAPAMVAATGLGFPGSVAASREGVEAYTKGVAEYRKGKLLDSRDFFAAGEKARKQMLAEVTAAFQQNARIEGDLSLAESGGYPGFVENGDESEFSFPAKMATRARGKDHPAYVIELEVVVTGPAANPRRPVSEYRVSKIRLIRGQAAPEGRGGPGGPAMD
jgi:hypothetical protein